MRVCALVVAALLCGCVQFEVGRFARMRGPQPPASPSDGPPTGRGRSCMTIVGVVPVTGPPSVSAALARAAGEHELRDAIVRYELRYWPLLGGRSCYAVEGRLP